MIQPFGRACPSSGINIDTFTEVRLGVTCYISYKGYSGVQCLVIVNMVTSVIVRYTRLLVMFLDSIDA